MDNSSRNTIITIVVVVIIIIIGIIAWASYTPATAPDNTVVAPTTTDQVPGNGQQVGTLVLNTSTNSSLGTYLVGPNGMTLYLYTPDKKNVSDCTGQCAVNWPPYVVATSTALNTGAGINGTVTTIQRADGGNQVTYNGIPLYYYFQDAKPGDVTGQGVGGVWYVVKP